MELHAIRLDIPSDGNIIVGQSHFIKTVEDIYEAIVNTVPQMKFGIAFNEASGACLTRVDGNDEELQAIAAKNATAVGAGHHVCRCATRRVSHQCEESHFGDAGSLHDFLRHGESGGSDCGRNGAGQGSAGRDRWVVAQRRRDGGGCGVAARVPAQNRIQEMKWLLVAALILPASGQSRFDQFDRELTRVAAEMRISELHAEVSERGRVVWKRGVVRAPERTVTIGSQEVAGQRIQWRFQPKRLTIQLPAKRLALVVSGDSKSLTEAPRLEDGNVLRSSIALAFFKDVAGLQISEREELIAHAFTALYLGERDASMTLAGQALDKFPELESTPDVTLLYLFAQLGLPEAEASATAVIKAHPSLPTAWFYYGQYLENQKRYREAAACFEQITMHQPPWHHWTVAAAEKELRSLK